jgi:hypothetical protein
VSDRRLTKAERREQARRERERIRREMARRRRNRWIGIALVVAAVAGVVVAGTLVGRSSDLPDPAETLAAAPDAARSAGCGDARVVEPYGGVSDPAAPDFHDRTHTSPTGAFPTTPPLSTYPSIPPTSGPHDPTPLRFGVYGSPPPIAQVIHSLEHGAVVIWYDPAAPQDEIDRIAAFFQRTDAAVGGSKVIVAPYDYPQEGEAGRLPRGVQMALVAWHRLRECGSPSLPVAFAFVSRFASAPNDVGVDYEGEAPEPGASI